MKNFTDHLIEGAMADKAKKSGISVATLRKVYNRGVAAWKTGHRPGTTPQQWGHARVNAFITKKKKGGLNHDTDLAHTEYDEDMVLEDACCDDCAHLDEVLDLEDVTIMEDGEKKGVKLNNIIRTSENPNKKFKVYVRDPSTKKIKVVRFGDPNMEIKRDDPGRRANFRARHDCANKKDKTKAGYWSCRQWSSSKVKS
ncbi:DUF5824 family protein [Alteromonas sp.]|uniref:DUF5824 family protein n=1 Tax=Alteromonas sp. TaxID=232 RepID=UPI000B69583F|nr:DUF5824 family protein [Alteromonas sp.]MAI39409.1 hypothetical protein [Alteromonas sp.]|tara:strand:+ start:1506 stop:2099 length:594 start_codon:yes stop_codon:yes gene_type:complete